MGKSIAFPAEGTDLEARIRAVREKLAKLDAKEPEDMASEAYERWADRHEALEDELDDLLDELEDGE